MRNAAKSIDNVSAGFGMPVASESYEYHYLFFA
jgi:hypothetical protein